MTDPATAELWTNLGILAAAGVAALAGYFGKKLFGGGAAPQSSSAVLTGVGLELGSREQTERLISAVNRVADVLEAKKLASLEAEIRRLSGEVDEMGEWQRPP